MKPYIVYKDIETLYLLARRRRRNFFDFSIKPTKFFGAFISLLRRVRRANKISGVITITPPYKKTLVFGSAKPIQSVKKTLTRSVARSATDVVRFTRSSTSILNFSIHIVSDGTMT